MRLLHIGTNHVGARLHQRGSCVLDRGDQLLDERQHLSLRGLSRDRGGRRPGCQGGSYMRPFEFQRAASESEAIAAAAAGARYLAGGTTLVDLMREEVETPEKIVD